MQRTYVRRRLTVFAVIVTMGAGGLLGVARAARAETPVAAEAAHRYVVHPGDTLWDIAAALSPEQDPRLVIDRIVAVNPGSSSGIVPGQALPIPTDIHSVA